LDTCSEAYLFNNYYFEFRGTRLRELEQIASISLEKKLRIDLVFSPFEYHSAKHHLYTVMEVIFNPELYLCLTKTTSNSDSTNEADREPKELPKGMPTMDIEDIKPDLNSPFLFVDSEAGKRVNLLISLSLSGFNPPPTR
jgi:hypothetical protein